jgi:5,6-dimethylbenzimidazole synthase
MPLSPSFDTAFRDKLYELFIWRRDVRSFRQQSVPADIVTELLKAATLAPSVGLSEPWRFVLVEDSHYRVLVRQNFLMANHEALAGYEGERARLYSSLKLEGLDHAPVHLAVYCDFKTSQGYGLGQKTMPETLTYSVVASVQMLWLAARTYGLGLGWVSILDPSQVNKTLQVPESWNLVAYLCLGYPADESRQPKLAEVGWEQRRDLSDFVFRR